MDWAHAMQLFEECVETHGDPSVAQFYVRGDPEAKTFRDEVRRPPCTPR